MARKTVIEQTSDIELISNSHFSLPGELNMNYGNEEYFTLSWLLQVAVTVKSLVDDGMLDCYVLQTSSGPYRSCAAHVAISNPLLLILVWSGL